MIDATDLTDLETRLRGRVTRAADAGFDAARSLWNARSERRPGAIVHAAGVADVIATVRFAHERAIPLAVRGGGHHVAGFGSCDDGIVLDLRPMNGIRIEPWARRAQVGPGVRVRDLDHEAQQFGLVTPGAALSTVGIGGYTLGGGLGWTSRAHGLACDNLLSADVVTATGELVRASETEHPDLFWGLRGGGGNFGVVTSFEFRLHPLGPEVLAGPIVHRIDDAPAILRFWRDYMREAPDALQCMPVIFPLPAEPGSGAMQGETVFALFPLWAGDPAEGEAAVRPLRAVGTPLSDGVGPARYATLLEALDDMYRAGHRNLYRSAFFDELADEAIDALVALGAPMPTPYSSLFLEPLGGAIARHSPDATAYPHRERRVCVTAVPKWEHEADDARMAAWADRLFDALAPHAAAGVYVNYLDSCDEQRSRVAWGDNRDRLVELKRRWDPDNVFRFNHNIPPG